MPRPRSPAPSSLRPRGPDPQPLLPQTVSGPPPSDSRVGPGPQYIAALEEDAMWSGVLEMMLKMVQMVMLGFSGGMGREKAV